MNFLNASLLAGAFALAIPIIIHLFHKSRFTVLPWGAMHLLESVLRINHRRVRMEQWLLLALRAALPLLLALLMARPVWKGAQALLGHAPVSAVVLLDNSYSMQASRAGVSTFGLAKEAAAKALESFGHGSEVQVLPIGAGGAPLFEQPTYDRTRALEAINQLTADYGAVTLPHALGFAAPLFGAMHESARRAVIITDFQRASFEPAEDEALGQALALLRKLPQAPEITFFDVGQEVTDNVAVESLEFPRLMVGVGQKISVRGNLRNYGEVPYPDLRVFCKVDGQERSVSQVNLGPKQSAQVLFTHAFDKTGSHVVEVYAEADALKADNSAFASIAVRDQLPVLLVNGDPSSEPLKGETDFAEIALQPYGAAKTKLADLITTKVIRPEALNAEALGRAAMVLLANVPRLHESQLSALRDFVQHGGGLLIAPGNRIDPAWYNGPFTQSGLLPATFGALAGDAKPGTAPAAVVGERFDNPALEIFNDPRNGRLSESAIQFWYRLAPAAGALTLARLETGDPFLVEKTAGEGHVILACTALDADWGNLPMRPFYLPLLQRLAVYLASGVYPPRNLAISQAISAFRPLSEAGGKAVLTLPTGATVTLPITKQGTRGLVEYSRTAEPGLYTLRPPDGAPIDYVVNAPRKESDLQRLTPGEIAALAQRHSVSVVHSVAEYEQQEHQRRFGREIWKPVLWVLLALCFGELLLQQRLAGVRRRLA